MTKVISYANVQIRYNADTSGLNAHRTDLAAITRLIRANETEGEKFIRRMEMLNRIAASGSRDQEYLAKGTQAAVNEFIRAATAAGRYEEAIQLLRKEFPRLVNEAEKFSKTMQNMSKKASSEGFGGFVKGFGTNLTPFGAFSAGTIGGVLGGIVSQQAVDMTRESIQAYADLTRSLVKLEVVLGSSNRAAVAFQELRRIAVRSSLTSDAVMEAAATMAQFGVSANDLVPTMARLSEISAGNNDRLRSLALAFGQVTAAGRLTGQETLQFVNAGFNPLAEISRTTGESMASLRKRMEEGGVAVKEVSNTFVTATENGGKFFGMAEKQSKVFTGELNRAKNELVKLKEELGAFVEGTGGVTFFESMTKNLRSEVNQMRSGRGFGVMLSEIFRGTEFGQEMGMMNAYDTMVFQETGLTPQERIKLREAEIKVLEEEEKARDAAKKKEAERAALLRGPVSQSLSVFGDMAKKFSGSMQTTSGIVGESTKSMGNFVRSVEEIVNLSKKYSGRRTPEQELAATTRDLGRLVRANLMSQKEAARILAEDMGNVKTDTLKTDLPAAVSLGTKEAYELINRAENDIRTRQLQEQRKQVTLQEATNALLKEIKDKPALGVMK